MTQNNYWRASHNAIRVYNGYAKEAIVELIAALVGIWLAGWIAWCFLLGYMGWDKEWFMVGLIWPAIVALLPLVALTAGAHALGRQRYRQRQHMARRLGLKS